MSEGIKETQEAIKGIATVVARVAAITKDGKVTFREKLSFAGDVMEILDAVGGAGRIPAEVRDIDAPEWDAIRTDLVNILVVAGFTHRTRDLADRILRAVAVCAFEIVDAFQDCQQFPPSALPA